MRRATEISQLNALGRVRLSRFRTIPEQVVGAFARAAMPFAAGSDDPPVRERYLFIEAMRLTLPTSGPEPGDDELPACIGFIEHELLQVPGRSIPKEPLYLY